MKKEAFDYLIDLMTDNKDIFIIFGGLGYPRVSEFLEKFPNRAINADASEQAMMDIAVGLAYEGKTVFTYTITPFYLRAFETIRTYINKEKLHIIMLGAGRDDDYSKDDGFSHEAGDIPEILATQKNIMQFFPDNKDDLVYSVNRAIDLDGPSFISLPR